MAILTFGDGQTYPTPDAAYADAEAGDEIHGYRNSSGNNIYRFATTSDLSKGVTFRGIHPLTFYCTSTGSNGFSVTSLDSLMVFDNISFVLKSANPGFRYASAATCDLIFKNCGFISTDNAFTTGMAFSGSGICTMFNCMIEFYGFSTDRMLSFGSAVSEVNLYNNTMIAESTSINQLYIISATVNIYNNILHCTLDATGATTLNEDYNIVKTGTFTNTNDIIIDDIATVGLAATTGDPHDYRTIQANERPGTKIANGVDLTALFTTDINGRARPATNAGYAIGCSYGFFGNSIADFPERTSVLTTDTVNGEAGLYYPANESDVKLGVCYGENNTGREGTYQPTDLPDPPNLTITDKADGTGVTYSLTGSEADSTNYIYYFEEATAAVKVLGVTFENDKSGSITTTNTGWHYFYALTKTASGYNVSEDLIKVEITDISDDTIADSKEARLIKNKGELITIQKPTETKTEDGKVTTVWSDYKTNIYAWIQPTDANTEMKFAKRNITITHKVYLTDSPDVTFGDRIKDASGDYYIIKDDVDQSGLGRLWELVVYKEV